MSEENPLFPQTWFRQLDKVQGENWKLMVGGSSFRVLSDDKSWEGQSGCQRVSWGGEEDLGTRVTPWACVPQYGGFGAHTLTINLLRPPPNDEKIIPKAN